jgi:transcription antitermination factor NusG
MCNLDVYGRQGFASAGHSKKISTRVQWDSEGEAVASLQENRFEAGTSSATQPLWYAIQTRARHEKRIGIDLREKGIHAFVPTLREAHQWSDRTKEVETPLFSCYVFVNLVASSAQRLEVLKTAGVFRFVRVNGEPAPIPDSQIESIQTVLANKLPISTCGFIQVGERVRIRGGAMDGVEGVLTSSKGGNKLVISVDLLQQSVEVTIEGYAVEAI